MMKKRGIKKWRLGSGPKVKSQATVLWRQTRGAAPDPRPAGSALGGRAGSCVFRAGGWGIGRRLTQKKKTADFVCGLCFVSVFD